MRILMAAVLFGTALNAEVLTFNFQPRPGPLHALFAGESFIEQEFIFRVLGEPGLSFVDIGGAETCQSGCSDNGTIAVRALNVAGIEMERVDRKSFSIQSFDAAEVHSFWQTMPRLRVIGFLASGGTVRTEVDLDGFNDGFGPGADFETFRLTGFSDVRSLQLQGIDEVCCQSDFSLDNIDVTAIPEPETPTFIVVGLQTLLAKRLLMNALRAYRLDQP